MTTMQMFTLVAGLSLFLYGISQVTRNLQKLAGPSLRQLVSKLTRSPIRGFFMGIIVAFSLQSSGAAILMLIAFANAGLISLARSVPIILGAGIGSTLTVQMLAFKIYKFAPIIITVGFVMLFFIKKRVWHYTGRIIFSFGLVFLGMAIMREGILPIQNNPAIISMAQFFASAHFWVAVIGFVLATIFQSSTAVLGLLLTLAFTGVVDLQLALPVVIGANVGSCMIGVIGSIGGKTEAKRIVWVQLSMKIFLGVVIFIFLPQYEHLIRLIGGSVARQIANAHTLFDILVAIIFYPVSGKITRLFMKIFPQSETNEEFGPKYLDSATLENPHLAMGQSTKEIMRIGEIVQKMFDDWGKVFFSNDPALLKQLVADDDKVDALQEAVTEFLTKMSMDEIDEETASLSVVLVQIVFELEHIGDVISKDLATHAKKKIEIGYYFSDEGFEEILSYHSDIRKNLKSVLDAIPLRDTKLAEQVIAETKRLVEKERALYRSHVRRLRQGLKETEETSTIHIDILSDLNKINLHISYIAYALLGKI